MRLNIITISILLLVVFAPLALAVTVHDSSGKEIEVKKPFNRIISLYPAHTENLAKLGLDTEIIGITSGDDYPAHILNKKRFSYRQDPEKFIAARPDLVLVRPMIERAYPQLLDKLKKAGITIVSLQPINIEEIFSYWRNLGVLVGKEKQAEQMVVDFQNELDRIRDIISTIDKKNRKRVYFEAIHRKMKTFAPQSIAIFVLEQAGGINVAADAIQVRKTNIGAYGKEKILVKGETIDVFLAQQGRMNPVTIAEIINEPGFQAIKAVREKNVHLIKEQIVSRPTMRILDGVKTIVDLLYPGLLNENK